METARKTTKLPIRIEKTSLNQSELNLLQAYKNRINRVKLVLKIQYEFGYSQLTLVK